MVDYQLPIIHGPKIGFVLTALLGMPFKIPVHLRVVTNE